MPSVIFALLGGAIVAVAAFVTADQALRGHATRVPTPHNATTSRVLVRVCTQPGHATKQWFYKEFYHGPYECTMRNDDYSQWSMLSAYRSGGSKDTHWMYTKDENDPRCLENWAYYSKDGKTQLAHITGRTTMQGDKTRWCALPVYRPGGVEGKQWAYCDCRVDG